MENSTTYDGYTFGDYVSLLYIKHNANFYLMVALSLVFLLGTVGNGLVIWFVIFKMKRTVTSVWFLTLGLTDFTFSLFQPLEVTRIAFSYQWPFGDFMCKLNQFVLPQNLYSSTLLLTVISIDRCACVIFPLRCRSHRTTSLAWKVSLGVWILSAACSLPFSIPIEAYTAADGLVYCGETVRPFLFKIRIILSFIIFFVVPLIIIVSCYTVIIVRLKRNPMVTSTKPLKIIAAVIICFIACWCPYHVICLIRVHSLHSYYLYETGNIALIFSTSLAYANSCINPFLYVFFGRDFKETFMSSIQSALRRALTEEPDWRAPERNEDQSGVLAINDGEMQLSPQSIECSAVHS